MKIMRRHERYFEGGERVYIYPFIPANTPVNNLGFEGNIEVGIDDGKVFISVNISFARMSITDISTFKFSLETAMGEAFRMQEL